MNESNYKAILENVINYSYLDYHRNCGIQVGDSVKVISKCSSYFLGWDNLWKPYMNDYIGQTRKVVSNGMEKGLGLDGSGFYFPAFCLKKVAPPRVELSIEEIAEKFDIMPEQVCIKIT